MEINKGFPKGRSLFLFIMGLININNEIYGSNKSEDIIYNDITVKEKLDTIKEELENMLKKDLNANI